MLGPRKPVSMSGGKLKWHSSHQRPRSTRRRRHWSLHHFGRQKV